MTDENQPPAQDATLAFSAGPARELVIPGYRVIRPLGEGGMGTVYLAEDLALGRRVAIKVISHGVAHDPAVRTRFLREARLLATIEHPNVVRVYSFGASEERAHLVMEYIEGETLADRIRRGPIAFDEAKDIVRHVIDALDAAWDKKIVHRDIKPSNILFDQRGNVKVADFGLAKGTGGGENRSDASLTHAGHFVGSPHYLAPEQAQGREADFRADIYSLGITLFEMLTGRRPFEGGSALEIIARHLHDEFPSISSLRRDIGKNLAELVTWMTQKNPEERPSSYRRLLDAVNTLDIASPTIIRKRQKQSRSIVRRGALAASALCFIATVALFVVFRLRDRTLPLSAAKDERMVVAIAPFWGPDAESRSEGHSMAALIQQQIVNRLGSAAKVIGIEETKDAVRDADSARALGERMSATAVIWGQAFALGNEREIQPSLTLVPRKQDAISNIVTAFASLSEVRSMSADLPNMPEAIRLQSQSANQIEMRKTSAEGIGDLVTFVAAMHALLQSDPQRALELLAHTRRTPDALYQKAVCFAQMRRDDDAARELSEALKLDAVHAPSLAMLADIDARASRFADAANHLRAAAATGRRFTTSEAALYNGTLYVKERYRSVNGSEETATMLAIDPAADRVLDRWELPGPPRQFSVDDSGMTVRCDIGRPRPGELTTLHFVKDRFQGPPLPHVPMVGRIRRMRPGWSLPNNFMRDLGFAGIKLPVGHFRYSPIEADPLAPKTLSQLKASLEKAIERDPTQPWHRFFLAITTWELGDHALANRIIDQMFAEPNRGTPYYEFSWMAKNVEVLAHRDWADRAYAEALKRRKGELQPIVTTATVERMVGAPFVRRASFTAISAPDPRRDHLWLLRARELTGLAWDGDELAAAAWAHYLRARGDAAGAAAEEKVYQRAHDFFGGARLALTVEDIMRAAQIAIVMALAVMIIVVFRLRRSVASMARNERAALVLLVLLLIGASSVRLFAASRARLLQSVPVPLSDSLGHPVIVASLDQILMQRDSDELRFITAVAHHLAGERRRAAELYRSIPWNDATENLSQIDSAPVHMPTAEMFVAAFHRPYPHELAQALRAAWGPRTAPDSVFSAAYEASQIFYLALVLGAAVLLLVAGTGDESRAFPAVRIALFVLAAAFVGIALSMERSASARVKLTVSGKYSAQWLEPISGAYPFPPDPTAEMAVSRAMGRSAAMRLFRISVAIGALIATASAASLARDRLRRPARIKAPLDDQPAEANT